VIGRASQTKAGPATATGDETFFCKPNKTILPANLLARKSYAVIEVLVSDAKEA